MAAMPFPPRWRYDFLRALDYFRACDAPSDERMADAIELLQKKQKPNGRWLMNTGMSGRKFFDLEKAGRPSRWNTLRALRILNWWNNKTNSTTLPLAGPSGKGSHRPPNGSAPSEEPVSIRKGRSRS
jgi:hypothetical protein